jgi:hypothetical protein
MIVKKTLNCCLIMVVARLQQVPLVVVTKELEDNEILWIKSQYPQAIINTQQKIGNH